MHDVTILAAAAPDWGIGLEGRLPWSVPSDLARFRRRTMGKTLIVGRRTAESLPNGLPGRKLVTVSRSGDYPSVAAAIAGEATESSELIVAGGGGVYLEALELALRAEITRIHGAWRCDAFMPNLGTHGWRKMGSTIEDGLEIENWSRT